MMKWLKMNPHTGHAVLILGLEEKNLERIGEDPICVSPREEMKTPFFVEHLGQLRELDAIYVIAGKLLDEISAPMRSRSLGLAPGDAVQVDGRRGTLSRVIQQPGCKVVVDVEIDGVTHEAVPLERVQRVESDS